MLLQKLTKPPNLLKFRNYSQILSAEDLFLKPDVYRLLNELTNKDLIEVHQPNKIPRVNSKIRLLTDERLENLSKEYTKVTDFRLQMPPIKNIWSDDYEILEQKEYLKSIVDHPVAVIDINPLESNRKRLICVRETDGKFRTATESERARLNNIYFPVAQRSNIEPIFFNSENLKEVMDNGKYFYILEKNCNQFEPDDPKYIKVCHDVYNHIISNYPSKNGIRSLIHTRHFGGFCLYAIINFQFDCIICDLLENGELESVVNMFELYKLVHPSTELSSQLEKIKDRDVFKMLDHYKKETKLSVRIDSAIEYHMKNSNKF